MDLYMREVELIVGNRTFTKPLTIEFDVVFDDTEKVNETEIKVYNLLDSTIKEFASNQRVVLNAGYQGDVGNIFVGTLKRQKTEWQGKDKITTLTCIDTNENYLSTKVSKTYTTGTPASVVLRDLIGRSGLSIAEFSIPRDFVYRRGKSVYGRLKDCIMAVAADCNAKVHINKNKIFVRDKNKGDNIGYEINVNTGLIEVTDVEQEKNGQKQKGYLVKTLLNHRITVDSIIKLNSKKASGLFRVKKGKHDGTNFYTEMEVYPA